MGPALPSDADERQRAAQFETLLATVASLLEDEDEWVSAMATVACELHHAFEYAHWTGFYRVIAPELLAVGPYQGHHGCLRIPFSRGACGYVARTQKTIRLAEVDDFEQHIACSASTRSELVVPVIDHFGATLAVVDMDSDLPHAFTAADEAGLLSLCQELGRRYGARPALR